MKIDTSTGAGGRVREARVKFNCHLDNCDACPTLMQAGELCTTARGLWRMVCLEAVRAAQAVK